MTELQVRRRLEFLKRREEEREASNRVSARVKNEGNSKQKINARKMLNCNVCDSRISLRDRLLTALESSPIPELDRAADNLRDRQAAASVLQGKIATSDFDVFLCYSEPDRAVVKIIGERLRSRGILPWLDEWELQPGLPWQRLLSTQIEKIKTVAVFLGSNGIGPWQNVELEAFLQQFVRRDCPVIPVILQGSQENLALPVFLEGMTWVDFRKAEPDPLERLIWGITGKRNLAERFS